LYEETDGKKGNYSKPQSNVANPIPPSKILPRRPSKKRLITDQKNPYNLARRPSSKNISNSYMSKYRSQKQIRKVYSKREISSGKKKHQEYVKPPSYEMKRVPSMVKKKERLSSKDRRTSVENKITTERKLSKEKRASKEKRVSKEKRSSILSRKESSEKKIVVIRKQKPIPKPCKITYFKYANFRQGATETVKSEGHQQEVVKSTFKTEIRRKTGDQAQTTSHTSRTA
jgi:hypothetical protein